MERRTPEPVIPVIGSNTPYTLFHHPALTQLYRDGHIAMTERAYRYADVLLAIPVLALVLTVPMYDLVAFAFDAPLLSAAASAFVCAVALLAVFTSLVLIDPILGMLRRCTNTPRRIWAAGLSSAGGAGALPAAALCSDIRHERDSFASYLAVFELTPGDLEVISTLIADGYESSVDELISLTLALR